MGIAIGAGFYECVVIAFVLMFLCIHFLPVLEVYLLENARNMNIYVELKSLDEIAYCLALSRHRIFKSTVWRSIEEGKSTIAIPVRCSASDWSITNSTRRYWRRCLRSQVLS